MAVIKNISAQKADNDLVKEFVKSGQLDVLGHLYERYSDLVYGVCLKYLNNKEDAKDAVVNIFEELIVKLRKYEVENFKSWLYQLSKNHCLMKIRSNKKYPKLVDDDVMHLPENIHHEDVLEKEWQLNQMEDCIEQLPAEQEKAIRLFYLKEKCYKEIASITNADINKVRSFIQNGRRNLKICMEKIALQKAE